MMVAAGLNSQFCACSVSPACGSEVSPGASTAIDAVEDWLSPGSVPALAVAGPTSALEASLSPNVGTSFLPVTCTR